jgi:hypothetical protein
MLELLQKCRDMRDAHGFARLVRERSLILASVATIGMVSVPVAKARADDVAVGDQLTLMELTRPDRFAWPAVFICRRDPGDAKAIVVPARDPDEMNERLLAAGIWPEDCHGGFSIRSERTDPGKLTEIEGRIGRGPLDATTDQRSLRGR